MRQPIRGPLRLVMPGTAPLPAEPAHNDHSPVPRDAGRRPGIADRAANLEARTPYLFLRHGTYYFKRKIPSDVRHGFPEFRSGQLFRSLGTGLLQQAKVLLAVEVTEFDLRVAQLRREAAQQRALVRAAEAREVYGARIEELCQLRIEDVQRINGSWCIRICDLGEGQEVKTLSSFRRVPLHDVVVRSGFIAYAACMAAAGHERVFPTLTNDNSLGTYSNAADKWYARFLDGVVGDKLCPVLAAVDTPQHH